MFEHGVDTHSGRPTTEANEPMRASARASASRRGGSGVNWRRMLAGALMGVLFVLGAGLLLGRRIALREAEAWSAGVRQVVKAIGDAGTAERTEVLRGGEIAGREEALGRVSAFDTFCQVR